MIKPWAGFVVFIYNNNNAISAHSPKISVKRKIGLKGILIKGKFDYIGNLIRGEVELETKFKI